jgi:chemotaxis response regulator CheB
MRYKYIPTVVVSTMVKEGSEMLENALEAGAFAAVDKDALSIYQGLERMQRELLPKLREAAATAGKAAPR